MYESLKEERGIFHGTWKTKKKPQQVLLLTRWEIQSHKNKNRSGGGAGCTPLIPAPGRLRQASLYDLMATLVYMASSRPVWTT